MCIPRPRNNTWTILGISIGVFVGVACLGFVVFWFLWRSKYRTSENADKPDDSNEQESRSRQGVFPDRPQIPIIAMDEMDLEKGMQDGERAKTQETFEGRSVPSMPTSYLETYHEAPIGTGMISKPAPTLTKPISGRAFDTYDAVETGAARKCDTLNLEVFRESNQYRSLDDHHRKAQEARSINNHDDTPKVSMVPAQVAQHDDKRPSTQVQFMDKLGSFVKNANHQAYVCPRLVKKLNLPADVEQRYRQAHEEAFDKHNSEEVRRKGRKRIRKIEKKYLNIYERVEVTEALGKEGWRGEGATECWEDGFE